MVGKRQTRCPEGYGVKSLRVMEKAKERGMHLRKDGRVVLPTGKVHEGTPQWGRDRINLSVDGECISIQTSRIVCFLAYGPPLIMSAVVDHINGDTTDDSVENLQWATYSENCRNQRATRTKTFEQRAIEACKNINPDALPDLLCAINDTILDLDGWISPEGEYDVTVDGMIQLRRHLETALEKAKP